MTGAEVLDSALGFIAAYGLLGLATTAIIERFIPILPSHALLVALGVATTRGHWRIDEALLAYTFGSALTCALWYLVGNHLLGGSSGSLERLARLTRIRKGQLGRISRRFKAQPTAFAFASQLLPVVRLAAPAIAGMLRMPAPSYVAYAALGVMCWNALFLSIGYVGGRLAEDIDTGVLAVYAMVTVIVLELMIAAWLVTARGLRISQNGPRAKAGKGRTFLMFLERWVKRPSSIGAIAPSSEALARLMTSDFKSGDEPVIELGPGTGRFTEALLRKGLAPKDLLLVESDHTFAAFLAARFRDVRVLEMDADRLGCSGELFGGRRARTIVSGLPLLSMSASKALDILRSAFTHHLALEGRFYQFTYGRKFPVPAEALAMLGLRAIRIGTVLANLPPASVYRVERYGHTLDTQSASKAGRR